MEIQEFRDICNITEVYAGECFGYYSLLHNPKCLVFNGKSWEDGIVDKDDFIWLPSFKYTHLIDKSKGWEQFDFKLKAFEWFQELKIKHNDLEVNLLYKFPLFIDNYIFMEMGIGISFTKLWE